MFFAPGKKWGKIVLAALKHSAMILQTATVATCFIRLIIVPNLQNYLEIGGDGHLFTGC